MLEINEADATSGFETLLDRVEQGEEVVILRDGKPVAQLVKPVVSAAREWTEEEKKQSDAAFARIREMAQELKLGPFDWEQYKQWRDEGRA